MEPSKKEFLKKYVEDVTKLRKQATDLDLSENEIESIFKDCFKQLEKSHQGNGHKNSLLKILSITLVVILCCYVLLYVHQPTSSIVLRNVQGLIYPGLKFVRYLSMPIIAQIPSLTELYDESCLVFNPYFYVNNMECWPCENVHSVINLTGSNNRTLYDSGAPFVVKVAQNNVHFDDVKQLYLKNMEIFNVDAGRLKSNVRNLSRARDLLNLEQAPTSTLHISWRINRMLPARVFRSLFPRPHIMSEWSGQSIERFLMIDGEQSPGYALPQFECSYVFLIQGSGSRMIALKPTKECKDKCKTVSVILKPSELLWYNWWYWRPISLPVENSTKLSVGYISSYC